MKKIWESGGVAFYFDGSDYDLEDDIYFEPGYYKWNAHVVLDWSSNTQIYDVVYLMELPEDGMGENGQIKPDWSPYYRKCDKGVVVRKLPNITGDDRRPPFVNRDNSVFILDIPGTLHINGEEFVWRE